MIEKSANFATYSRPLCWIVVAISLLVAILTLTGDAENGSIRGLLWLALAAVFAASAVLLGRKQPAPPPEEADEVSPAGSGGEDDEDSDRV